MSIDEVIINAKKLAGESPDTELPAATLAAYVPEEYLDAFWDEMIDRMITRINGRLP